MKHLPFSLPRFRKSCCTLPAALCLLLPAAALSAQTIPPAAPLVIDATAPTPPPGPANYTFVADEARSPSGHVLGLNAQYLTLDGKPWLPVMGEMHYSRVPEAEWEPEILKMKSAGVTIISAYIIWIHHEEVEGQWDWSGQKDLRRFVQLCAKHGMYVVPRIGPWSHAEVRNGGFPDWLLAKAPQNRSNDPTYLHYVDLFYQQIGEQLKGLMWNQGGPVIAIQLENEYNKRCALCGTQHILKLKELSRDAGLKVPFYTETGWDGAAVPAGEVLTVDGGYPDAPWDASIQKLLPSGVYMFRQGPRRSTNDMGAIGATPASAAPAPPSRNTPSITAEMGGGMQITYHRRPIVSADDIAAMMPVALGSGVNLYGSYIFHGGENPDGKLTTLQESLATRYANDLPQKTYDFQAPIGEFGDERESLLKLKTWNYFLNDFGPSLAPMDVRRPQTQPTGPGDFTVPRIAARTSGSSGFLFVNNHVREYQMPAFPNFQVTIDLPGSKTLTLPSKPVTLPADAYFVWPFNMDLSGLHLRFATAQPLAILGTAAAPVYAFFAQPFIPAEFVIDDMPGLKLDSSVQAERHDGAIWLQAHATPVGLEQHEVRFTLPGGRSVTIWVIPQQNAEESWRIASGGNTQLLVTPEQVFVDDDTATLAALGNSSPASSFFVARLLPQMRTMLVPSDPDVKLTNQGPAYSTSFPKLGPGLVTLSPTPTKPADTPAPLPDGFKPSSRPRVVAAAPAEADWSRAGVWSISIPNARVPHPSATRMGGMNNARPTPESASSTGLQYFLRIHYIGDVARISVNGHLLDDNFADGRPWLIGLDRFAPQLAQSGGKLDISIYPLRPNPPIFFEPGSEPKPDTPPASVTSVELLTQYTLKLKLVPGTR